MIRGDKAKALEIMFELQQRGFEAYLVGGCVRDMVMGIEPHDYDIATNAKPEEIIEIFGGKQMGSLLKREGEEYGTIIIKIDGCRFEITTYNKRRNRGHNGVQYFSSIEEDLSCRDFTINAMAMNIEGNIIDPFNAVEDIVKKQIRVVSPYSLADDKLRILRAIRFSAQFGYSIEAHTYLQMVKYAPAISKTVAKERIHDELVKMFGYKGIGEALNRVKDVIGIIFPFEAKCMGFNQNSKYHHLDVWEHIIEALRWYRTVDTNMDYRGAMAIFLHDIGKPVCYQDGTDGYRHYLGHEKASAEIAKEFLIEYKFKKEDVRDITTLVLNHDFACKPTRVEVRKLMKSKSKELMDLLLCIRYADIMAHRDTEKRAEQVQKWTECIKLVTQIRRDGDCLSLSHLAINGDTLKMWGFQGKEIGEILNYTLDAVITDRVNNDINSIYNWKYIQNKLRRKGENI